MKGMLQLPAPINANASALRGELVMPMQANQFSRLFEGIEMMGRQFGQAAAKVLIEAGYEFGRNARSVLGTGIGVGATDEKSKEERPQGKPEDKNASIVRKFMYLFRGLRIDPIGVAAEAAGDKTEGGLRKFLAKTPRTAKILGAAALGTAAFAGVAFAAKSSYESQRQYADVSPALAQNYAIRDLNQTLRSMAFGQGVAQSNRELGQALDKLLDTMTPIVIGASNLTNNLLTPLVKMADELTKSIRDLMGIKGNDRGQVIPWVERAWEMARHDENMQRAVGKMKLRAANPAQAVEALEDANKRFIDGAR